MMIKRKNYFVCYEGDIIIYISIKRFFINIRMSFSCFEIVGFLVVLFFIFLKDFLFSVSVVFNVGS